MRFQALLVAFAAVIAVSARGHADVKRVVANVADAPPLKRIVHTADSAGAPPWKRADSRAARQQARAVATAGAPPW
ncbi:hypothetical protein DFH09DRAFT_55296 [Mycena vulgaris]|nr:hypothetical protein DFH09DRAFT_55296 [Mycena vulgaris]